MRKREFLRSWRLGLVLALGAGCLYAQGDQNQEDLIKSLLLRVQALEEKVEQLKQSAPGENRPAATPIPESIETEPTSDSIPVHASAPPGGWTERVRLHAYADAQFEHNLDIGLPDRYQVGELVLFGTARIAPDVSALAEVVLHTADPAQAGDLAVSVERLLLQYRLNDYFNLGVGQYRTNIGYYSTAYLRGAWFQTAITSPRLFAFEEDGGMLPLHNVGLTVSGKLPSGWLGLHYTAEIGNSATWATINATPATVSNRHAVNFALASHPRPISGLEIGASGYRDRFQPVAGLDLYRSLWSAHVVYNANRFEFLNEGVISNIRYEPAHAWGTLSGFYSQLGYRAGSAWGPYFRVEKLTVHGSPFFDSLSSVVPWRSLYTGGVRYDWKESVALKFEMGTEADIGLPHVIRAAAQVAFAF